LKKNESEIDSVHLEMYVENNYERFCIFYQGLAGIPNIPIVKTGV